ncbi:hypothetical protein CFP56_044103 [Quercus suber]|uniref:Uncharacterized protein n=1 Tax=Quercus suber TaxID=58331 RepID=A0AAW0IPI3_QUESU
MARGLTLSAGLTAFIALVLVHETCSATTKVNHHCAPSSCGNIHNISFPFRLKTDPKRCGDSRMTSKSWFRRLAGILTLILVGFVDANGLGDMLHDSFFLSLATDGCGHGSRPWGGAIADLLLGLLKSLLGAALVLEENKGVAFGITKDAVGDRLAILDLVVLTEDGGEGFGCGVPAEAMDEDLAVGGVRIDELTHDFNQVRLLAHSFLDQSHEMVLREWL